MDMGGQTRQVTRLMSEKKSSRDEFHARFFLKILLLVVIQYIHHFTTGQDLRFTVEIGWNIREALLKWKVTRTLTGD